MLDFLCKESYDLRDFVALVSYLRSPNGCPWDQVQTHESIRRNFLEETYEACEAIDAGDLVHMREELGDVLMQVLFHTDIEREAGHFDIDDVADAACKKLVYRHPHVFRRDEPDAPDWDTMKQRERAQTTTAEAMDSVARSLPALWRCDKIQAKAAKTGFEWPDVHAALDKVDEETRELRAAVASGDTEAIGDELGDLLFAAVKVGRFAGLDSEQALHGTCEKLHVLRASIPSRRHTPRAKNSSAGLPPWRPRPQTTVRRLNSARLRRCSRSGSRQSRPSVRNRKAGNLHGSERPVRDSIKWHMPTQT